MYKYLPNDCDRARCPRPRWPAPWGYQTRGASAASTRDTLPWWRNRGAAPSTADRSEWWRRWYECFSLCSLGPSPNTLRPSLICHMRAEEKGWHWFRQHKSLVFHGLLPPCEPTHTRPGAFCSLQSSSWLGQHGLSSPKTYGLPDACVSSLAWLIHQCRISVYQTSPWVLSVDSLPSSPAADLSRSQSPSCNGHRP